MEERKPMGITIGDRSWDDWRKVPKEEFDGQPRESKKRDR